VGRLSIRCEALLKVLCVLADKPTDKPLARAQRVPDEGEGVVSRWRKDCEGRRGPLSWGPPHSTQLAERILSLPVRGVGRGFVVAGRIVGYVLLFVTAFAVSAALTTYIAVALQKKLVGSPKPFGRAPKVQEDGRERVVRGLRQDNEGGSGPPGEESPPVAQQEKKTLPPPVSTRGHAFAAVGRIVGYALLIVAAFAVSVALGACIALALEYLVGWPDTWWL
jgi:hypothetical protein